jgi:hypothetical protein
MLQVTDNQSHEVLQITDNRSHEILQVTDNRSHEGTRSRGSQESVSFTWL